MSVATEDVRRAQRDGELSARVDFKMVTFSLGGKDYGIDIMKVKEIAKSGQFTFVPNCPPYVLGVHNLRGEIISIIDFRKMFELEAPPREDGQVENILILRLEDTTLGVVVDAIDRVVGIESSSIQPPHPIFADININHIDGIVEFESKTYLVLSVERIFGREVELTTTQPTLHDPVAPAAKRAVELSFIIETLATFKSFHVSGVNRAWAEKRFAEWREQRSGDQEVQLTSERDAAEFLRPFPSSARDHLMGDTMIAELQAALPVRESGIVKAWNVGCGKGYESYSLVHAMRGQYTGLQVKVWAVDKDLLSISTASDLVLSGDEIPEGYLNAGSAVQGAGGYRFTPEIRDSMIFEYHDILHGNQYPSLDLIVARDVLSFLKPDDQARVLAEFGELLVTDGLLVMGDNEDITQEGWSRSSSGQVHGFRKGGSSL